MDVQDSGKTDKPRGWALRQSNEEANRLTRTCLRTAVLQLAQTQGFDKMTVTGVTARAGVSPEVSSPGAASESTSSTNMLA